jgi:superfamily I DNA/RNA helicase
VIQGRALGDRETYLVLKRIGRGTPLSDEDRQVIFFVYEEYKKLLSPEIDFDELILLSLQRIRKEGLNTPYYGVVVDEIQDLTESAMRLIKAAQAMVSFATAFLSVGQLNLKKLSNLGCGSE